MSEQLLTCAECDELLLDYFEGELNNARRSTVEAHASSCARCQGLIRDVNGIKASAANLPELAPSRDLWTGIESRIQPEVVALTPRRQGIHLSHRLIGIAAAALVVISSSITYVVTKPSSPGGKRPVRVVEQSSDIPVLGQSDEIPSAQPTEPVEQTVAEPAKAETPRSATPRDATPVKTRGPRPDLGGSNSSGTVRTTLVTATVKSSTETALAPEIDELQDMLQQRRDKLDPSTVKIVEDNLALIDAAVKQARAALQRDPASGFLTERLDNALQKNVELLRTVALLPSRS